MLPSEQVGGLIWLRTICASLLSLFGESGRKHQYIPSQMTNCQMPLRRCSLCSQSRQAFIKREQSSISGTNEAYAVEFEFDVPGRPQKTHDLTCNLTGSERRPAWLWRRVSAGMTPTSDCSLFANWRIIWNFDDPTVKNPACDGTKTASCRREEQDKAMSPVQEKEASFFCD